MFYFILRCLWRHLREKLAIMVKLCFIETSLKKGYDLRGYFLKITETINVLTVVVRDHNFMTSMKNVQCLQPSFPFFCLSKWVQIGQAPHPWTSKLRLPTTPNPIPFGILAAYWLYLVDVSITYYVCATHNSLQRKINLTLSWRRPLSYRWFLYDSGHCHERVKLNSVFHSKTQANSSHLEC